MAEWQCSKSGRLPHFSNILRRLRLETIYILVASVAAYSVSAERRGLCGVSAGVASVDYSGHTAAAEWDVKQMALGMEKVTAVASA